ncbi:MAG: DUF3883 domain-containing protein [Micrococcales bacterium]|nr:DUF3883 domain-containing protein [Micrococcales bacterium]
MTEQSADTHAVLESICRENLAVYRESPGRLQEDVSQESQVAHDYRGRLVYELLQNADDSFAGIASTDDRVLFRVTDDELWVANTGRAFTEADVRGLCGLGASSKVGSLGPKRASIGHKGLGFKSVLEITDAPEAYSETVAFRLGKHSAGEQVRLLWGRLGRGQVRDVPAMRFPITIDQNHAIWRDLQREGFRTAFRFPFREGFTMGQVAALAHQLLTLPMTSVIFLKHLEEVLIEVVTAAEKTDRQWLLERHRVAEAGIEPCSGMESSGLYRVDLVNMDAEGDRYWVAHNGEVPIGSHRDGLSGPAWDGVDITEVSVAVRDEDDPRIAPSNQRFHVFLPTQEPSGCSVLVNGAFTTDLSRQHVQVDESPDNYNGYLVHQAADTFVRLLMPHLIDKGGLRYVLRILDRSAADVGPAADLLTRALTLRLAATSLIPSGGEALTLREVVLPSPLLEEQGPAFVHLLAAGSTVSDRHFPDPEFCEGELAAVCADYGATALTAARSLQALARHLDPAKAVLRVGSDSRYRIDPVLDLCALMWDRADASERQQLEGVARAEAVFPVGEDEAGRVRRIALGDETAFYPPAGSAEDLPLRRIRFLAHAVCWGNLGRSEQSSVLGDRMKAWDGLFGIKEFRFEEVMRAAVLPGFTRKGGIDTELREANRSIEALATICRLAGKTTKPENPLPMGRLGSDRAFFNLSRLEVPCRPDQDGQLLWAPAHQVYFGRDWVGDDSVEGIFDAMAAAGQKVDLKFLAAPEAFAEFAGTLGVQSEEGTGVPGQSSQDEGEVDLEDDTDEALETTADDRWRNFFAWLGVSRGLRLIHFHDVDDTGTGWTSTKGLGLPGGWAFNGLNDAWSQYQSDLIGSLESDPRWTTTDHYLYQVHNLDRLDEIATVARQAGNAVAGELLTHLVRNWPYYAKHTMTELALVGTGKWPSSRSAPPRATTEEVVSGGPDFWLHRLRNHAICPTSRGPRRPGQTWRRTDELERRLARGGRSADTYLPVLTQPEDVSAASLRACLDELQVRGELTPAAFTVEDARDLCERLSQINPDGVTEQIARRELRPIYRQMFALLAGTPTTGAKALATSLLAARTATGIEFLPARDVLYASVPGSRERSGVQDRVPLFVLEAEPGADRPLRELFGVPFLEEALQWSVRPGELALDEDQMATFRGGLHDLRRSLLARLSADRADRSAQDQQLIDEFIERVEPVESLSMSCAFKGEDLGDIAQRTYHVRHAEDGALQGFIVWTGPEWPPIAEDAQALAMALAQALGVNTVETFLSFITASDEMRTQLLELAGASDNLPGVAERLAGHDDVQTEGLGGAPESTVTSQSDGESTEAAAGSRVGHPPEVLPAAPRVPLHHFDDLLIDGEIIRIMNTPAVAIGGRVHSNGSHSGGGAGSVTPGAPRAAQGTDLSELDRLGMRITIAFEQRRFPGRSIAILPGDEPIPETDVFIVDVSSPGMIKEACEQSPVVERVLAGLGSQGISDLYPGFDILTIVGTEVDRMIELKSSGVDAKVQAMSWNEWKTAGGPMRDHFWLYLVGNLRADLQNAAPFVRAVRDPIGTLASSKAEDVIRKRTIQLRVREFAAADELKLSVRSFHGHD